MGRVQRSMAVIVTSGMKNPPKKLEILQILPRFQALALLFHIEKLDTSIRKYSLTMCFSQCIKVRN